LHAHAALPSLLCALALHCWQVDASLAPILSEYLPAMHNTQSDSASFPVVAKYLPAVQLVQAVAALAPEYVPAGHGRHSPPLLPK
jgi:hypothetical protein